jgi:hypothetical protein
MQHHTDAEATPPDSFHLRDGGPGDAGLWDMHGLPAVVCGKRLAAAGTG